MNKKHSCILISLISFTLITLIYFRNAKKILLQPRGMVLGLYAGLPEYNYSFELHKIASTGATCVSIQAIYLMETGNSCEINRHPTSSPSELNLRRIFQKAKANNLRILFFPTINIKGEANNAKWWRGNIEPSDWNLWWHNYTEFNVHLAHIAQQEKVEWYSVGTEMASTHRFPDRWRELVSKVREVYKGKITYSVNFDSHDSFTFGDCLDVIGINTYDPIAKRNEYPTSEQIRDGWWWIIIKARTLHARFHRPVMITEVGYPSVARAHAGPWDFRTNKPKDLKLQNFLISGALDVLKNWNDGEAVFYYLYGENLNQKPVGGPEDRTYSVWDKPAEATLRSYFYLPIFKKSDISTTKERHDAIIQTLISNLKKVKKYKRVTIPLWAKKWIEAHPEDLVEAKRMIASEFKTRSRVLISQK